MRTTRRRLVSIFFLVGLLGLVGIAGGPGAYAASITSAGPLTRVDISPDLNCAVDHAG